MIPNGAALGEFELLVEGLAVLSRRFHRQSYTLCMVSQFLRHTERLTRSMHGLSTARRLRGDVCLLFRARFKA